MPLGEALLPGAARLSPRGQVLENGAPRFFRRLAEGVFDLDDLKARTDQLADFVDAAGKTYQLPGPPIAVGFSNGANIAAAMLLLRPGVLRGALLFRPMVPLVPDPLPSLAGVPVGILAGRADPIVRRGTERGLGRPAAAIGRAGRAELDRGRARIDARGSGDRKTMADPTVVHWFTSVFLLYRILYNSI